MQIFKKDVFQLGDRPPKKPFLIKSFIINNLVVNPWPGRGLFKHFSLWKVSSSSLGMEEAFLRRNFFLRSFLFEPFPRELFEEGYLNKILSFWAFPGGVGVPNPSPIPKSFFQYKITFQRVSFPGRALSINLFLHSDCLLQAWILKGPF